MKQQYPTSVFSLFEAVSVIGPLRPLIAYGAFLKTRDRAVTPYAYTVVTTCRSGALNSQGARDLEQSVADVGMNLHRISERFAFDIGVLPALYRLIKGLRPGIIETHNFKSHLLLFLLRAFSPDIGRIPWIAYHHGYTMTSRRVRFYQLFDRITLRNADHVVTFCRPFAKQVEDVGVRSSRVTVIANTYMERSPPDPGQVIEVKRKIGAREGERVLLCVGRLSTEKGQRYLLEAVRLLAKQSDLPPVRVALVGEGPELEFLRKQFPDLRDNIAEVGYQSDPWPYYFAADIVVIPSLSEGSPLVLFEAMIAGAPIVASAVGGIPEVVQHDFSAKLIPPGDAQQLGKVLSDLLKNPGLARQLSDNTKKVATKYTPERYASRLAEIYDRVLKMKKDTALT